jgi:hypothetical protein
MADLDTEGNLKSLIRARPGKPELAAQCIAAFWHCKCLLWVTTGLPVRRSYVSFRRVRTWSAREHRKNLPVGHQRRLRHTGQHAISSPTPPICRSPIGA